MGQGDWTLETAPSGKGIIKAHSTLSNNFFHTLNINKHDSWDITKPKLVLDHIYTITYPSTEHGTGGGFVISDTRTETITAFLQNERLLYCLPGRNGSHQACCRRAYHLQQPTNNLLERQPICTTGSLQ